MGRIRRGAMPEFATERWWLMSAGQLNYYFMRGVMVLFVILTALLALKLLAGMLTVLVFGIAVGIGAILGLVLLNKMRKIWRRFSDRKLPQADQKSLYRK